MKSKGAPVGSNGWMRHAAAFAGLAFLSGTIACGAPSPQTQPTPSVITFTLTNTDCTSLGVGAVLQSQFTAVVVNSTSSRAAFNLHRLLDGHAYRELEEHIQARQQAIASGSDRPTFPPMTVHVTGVDVEAGQRGRLEGALSSGEYGLVCRRDSPTGATEAIYVRGPFRVG
jgi:poly(3-hydroxybutyrate) depolymerase